MPHRCGLKQPAGFPDRRAAAASHEARAAGPRRELAVETRNMGPLAKVRIFEGIPEDARRRLECATLAFEPRPGSRIFAQGDHADALYAIVGGEGRVRIGELDRHSKSVMVEVFQTGDVFGEIAVIDGGTRTADGVVEGRVRLLRIGSETFLDVLADTPALATNLCLVLARRIRRTFLLFHDAVFEPLEVRLARQILY